MRGERPRPFPQLRRCNGSSPHARGTLDGRLRQLADDRFIPACAGNAPPVRRVFAAHTVHPRMRGERCTGKRTKRFYTGSSPHARGTPCALPVNSMLCRFIPACAGNAPARAMPHAGPLVHPRMRGERFYLFPAMFDITGSSPHARGTHRGLLIVVVPSRFIPACAGNAKPKKSRSWIAIGSSPHARGTRTDAVRHARPRTVHPRMRGERHKFLGIVLPVIGSSPHARGTPRDGKD